LHPTQLYEAIAALLAALLAVLVHRYSRIPGAAFLTAAIWLSACQWLNAGFRVETGTAMQFGRDALFQMGFVIAGTLTLAWRIRIASESRRPDRRPGRPPFSTGCHSLL